MCACMLSHVRLCDPLDCSPLASTVHRNFQARRLEWIAITTSRGLPDPGIEPASSASPALQAYSLTAEPLGKNYFIHSINRIYMSIPICQFILPFSHFDVHTFVLYAYVSIPALQIGSSVPLF